jgi:starch synthase
MQVAHLLRKYNPSEWGGTETAVKRLCDGLRAHQVQSMAFCPQLESTPDDDPMAEAGHSIRRFRACVPVWGISPENRKALVSMGGNLMSFGLIWDLWREPGISLVHAHTQNRLGGIGLTVSRLRNIPLVVSIHGGVLDLPAAARDHLAAPLQGGFEWGKVLGAPLRSRRVLEEANAIITCNKKEAQLLRQKYPQQNIMVQPHGVSATDYEKDQRPAAFAAFPSLVGRKILLMAGRIDTVKNQNWVVNEAPCLVKKFPELLFVMAGSVTDQPYAAAIERDIKKLGLGDHFLLTGGLPPGDPRLIGLFQAARALVLPSLSEPFGLVILESWASGTPVIASSTSGALELIEEGKTGWLFDLKDPDGFHVAAANALTHPIVAKRMGEAGQQVVKANYDTVVLAGRVKRLYEQLIEEMS